MWSAWSARRERRPTELEQRDQLARLEGAGQQEDLVQRPLRQPAGLLVPEDRAAVQRRDVDGLAVGVIRDVARGREEAVPGGDAADGDLSVAARQVAQQDEHAHVGEAGADVVPA